MYVVEKVLNGKLHEYCYFIHENDKKESICIDPGYNTETIMDYIEKSDLMIDSILLTHGHFDHILSCKTIQDKNSSKIYISKEDEEILYDPHHNYSEMIHKFSIDKFDIANNVYDDGHLNIINLDIRCISTPGHTKGGFSYYIESEGVLFSGDTLFHDTFGRTDLYGGDFDAIRNSIVHKLFLLPDNTVVYPGHGQPTTIGYEKNHNEIIWGVL